MMQHFFVVWVSSSALNKNDSGNTDLSFYVYLIFRVHYYYVPQDTLYKMVLFLIVMGWIMFDVYTFDARNRTFEYD